MDADDLLGLVAVLGLIEPLAFLGFRLAVFSEPHPRPWRAVATLYWFGSSLILAAVGGYLFAGLRDADGSPQIANAVVVALVAVYLAKLVMAASTVLELLRRAALWAVGRALSRPLRRGFASRIRLLPRVGLIVASLAFLAVIWSGSFGRSSVAVYRHQVTLDSLPAEFDGLRIVHLSDIHASSLGFSGQRLANRLVAAVNDERPDLIVYTGDYGEAEDFARTPEIFGRLNAPLGKFAVLGNHDFGGRERASDNWKSPQDKQRKLEALRQSFQAREVKLLWNDAAMISRGTARIAILGVGVQDSHHGFDDADIETAERAVVQAPFSLLLVHGPEYWETAVQGRRPIYLTFAGHTHGGQVGIGIGRWMWSPASLAFHHWGGFYEEGNHCLNVNRGIGFVGLPLRLNMPADVSVIVLRTNHLRFEPRTASSERGSSEAQQD